MPRLAADVTTESVAGGGVRLVQPVPPRRGLHAWLARRFKLADRLTVELDDVGAFVVARLDGRSLDALAGDVAAHCRLTRREAEAAIAQFMQALVRRRLVQVDG